MFYIQILSLFGIGLALYLLVEQFTQSSFRPCTINATINCDAVISGPLAKTFGIPTPLYGLFGYIGIFLTAFFHKKKILLSITSLGLIFCLWIAYQELVLFRVICPVCILCQIIMTTVFILSIVGLNKEKEKH